MARHVRDITTSTWFHVFNRGADRQDIVSSDADYVLFEQLLAEGVARFGIEIHAYALMSNHFHLLLQCPDGQLSPAMQRICGRFGAAFNQRTGRDGPLFTSRFKSVPVTSDAQLDQVARYIHRNALAIVPAQALRTYRWSSLGILVGARQWPIWVSSGFVLRPDNDPAAYLRYVLEPQPTDTTEGPCQSFSCDQIERAINTSSAIDERSILTATRGWAHPRRTLAITLAVELRAAPTGELAERYGVDAQSIRRIARHGRVAVATSEAFAGRRNAALQALQFRRAA